jgi:deoxyribodipyrimidine photo-lyase
MIAASFLVKDLLVDWRWGEAYFAEKLIDFDLSANNGGWQWAASTGCDAQPWFRIFNPITQSIRFDPQGKFIKKYIPELSSLDNDEIHAPWLSQTTRKIDYPQPIVDHASQRIKALALYKSAKS